MFKDLEIGRLWGFAFTVSLRRLVEHLRTYIVTVAPTFPAFKKVCVVFGQFENKWRHQVVMCVVIAALPANSPCPGVCQ